MGRQYAVAPSMPMPQTARVFSVLLYLSLPLLFHLCASYAAAAPSPWFHSLIRKHRSAAQGWQRQEDSHAAAAAAETLRAPARVFFEVARPLDPPPRTKPCASLLALQHAFGDTFTPAIANYSPPSAPGCSAGSDWALVVLRWRAACRGRQFDRIAGAWIGGVELLRTCTAEPTRQGITWEVKKDITRYASLLSSPQTLVVELGNVVDRTFTGVFHINLTLDFFPHPRRHRQGRDKSEGPDKSPNPSPVPSSPADLILPISSPSPFPSGHWFQIANESSQPTTSFALPPNSYRAVLEVYLSFHGDDEFWYTNPPNDYISSNNLTGIVPGNGPFREVQAFLDDRLVGAVCPFPVVYTGGIVNLLWRPAAAIGAFDLPTYDFELTSFVGSLVDGKQHSLRIKVKNAIGRWLVDANLHVWLDHSRSHTYGELLAYSAPESSPDLSSHFQGLDGKFHASASRALSYSGYVVSSGGNFTVAADYSFMYNNVLDFEDEATLQKVVQSIETSAQVTAHTSSNVVYKKLSYMSFPFDYSCLQTAGVNKTIVLNCTLAHALDQRTNTFSTSGSTFSTLNNSQQGDCGITVQNNLVTAGIAALQQQYRYEGSDGCYARKIHTKNSTLLYDSSSSSCAAVV